MAGISLFDYAGKGSNPGSRELEPGFERQNLTAARANVMTLKMTFVVASLTVRQAFGSTQPARLWSRQKR